MAELGTTGLIVAGALGGIADALMGSQADVPVSPPAEAERKNDFKNIWIVGGIALAVVVGIVLLVKK